MPLADLKQRLEAIGVGRSNRIDILASEVLFQDLRPLRMKMEHFGGAMPKLSAGKLPMEH
jgi:hypothetical protein